MKVIGIIAEYNPFHLGHQYQIDHARRVLHADYIVVAMSGDYVQRGSPALLPKHRRAEMALRCGADLVLELPVQASSASAEFFAGCGVSLLNGLGVIDELCFGSESGDTALMEQTAALLEEEPEAYRNLLRENLKKGMSFPAARSDALVRYSGDDRIGKLVASPNNILGIEYCRAILRQGSHMRPVTLKRRGAAYHEQQLESVQMPSASAIRQYLNGYFGKASDKAPDEAFDHTEILHRLSSTVPKSAFPILQDAIFKKTYLNSDDFSQILHYCLLNETMNSLTSYVDMSSELAARILSQINNCQSFEQFTDLLKTRELTRSRIQRALLHTVLHITGQPRTLSYARILGFRKDSSPLLKEIKTHAAVPVITKAADAPKLLSGDALTLWQENLHASNIYESVVSHKSGLPYIHEYKKQLVRI